MHMPACPLFHAGAHRHAVLVFFLRGKSAADVAFGFVDVQNDARLGGKGRIDLFEAFRDVCWCQVRNKKYSGLSNLRRKITHFPAIP